MTVHDKTTPNGHFEIDFYGHVPTEDKLKANFRKLDAMLGPKLTAADVGKAIVVVDNGNGSYGFGVAP